MTRMSFTKMFKVSSHVTSNFHVGKSLLTKVILTVGCLVSSLTTVSAAELSWLPKPFHAEVSPVLWNSGSSTTSGFNVVSGLGNVWDPTWTAMERTAYTEPSLSDRLMYRYTDPNFVRFVGATNSNSAYGFYDEMNKLIDERHVSPKSYDDRVRNSINNLLTAMDLPTFWKINGSTPTREKLASLKETLRYVLDEETARNSTEARQVLNWVVSTSADKVGLKPQLTIIEFVYGTVESMDRFSGISLPAVSGEPRVGLEENVVGIGVEIESDADGVRVVKVLSGGPALDAGLKKGDIIRKINGSSIVGMTVSEVASRIIGKAGSTLNVEMMRDNNVVIKTMTRRSVTIPNVSEFKMVDPVSKVGYVKLERFATNSAAELESAMWTLYRQNMKSMILDLRGNPGGLLTSAISISDLYLPNGTIVSTKGRNAEDNSVTTAMFAKTWKTPLVVLVDNDSASASEIVAAAIQDNKRGLVVGTKSYGKGTVQSHFEMRSVNATARLTTANFFAPSGRVMAGVGVTPDVLVDEKLVDNDAADVDVALNRAIEIAKGTKVIDLANSAKPANTNVIFSRNGV
ncbi:MAG: S41 family peptidase [Planctomycetaceae bacterium]